jgi:hypothetical protein
MQNAKKIEDSSHWVRPGRVYTAAHDKVIATKNGFVTVWLSDGGRWAVFECIAHGRVYRRRSERERGRYHQSGLVRLAGQFARWASERHPHVGTKKAARRHLKVA